MGNKATKDKDKVNISQNYNKTSIVNTVQSKRGSNFSDSKDIGINNSSIRVKKHSRINSVSFRDKEVSQFTMEFGNIEDRINSGDNITGLFNSDRNTRQNKLYKDMSQFEILTTIGKGILSKVLLVRCKNTDNLFAIKCFKKVKILKMNKLNNIINEKYVLEQVGHPFIVNLLFTFQNIEKIFFGFSFINGGELLYHLNKTKKFSEDTAKFYAAEIYLALSYLSNNNIVYR